MKFDPPKEGDEEKSKKKREGRKVTYINPPFSKNVKTNIGGRFPILINKCFPNYHPLHKIVNRNTVKLSYKCMPNFKANISRPKVAEGGAVKRYSSKPRARLQL